MAKLAPLKARLFILLAVLMLPVVGLLLYHAYTSASSELEASRVNSLQQARKVAAQISLYLRNEATALERLSQRSDVRNLDPQNCDPLMPELSSIYGGFINITTMDMRGNIICSVLPFSASEKPHVRSATSFEKTFNNPGLDISEPLEGPISGHSIVAMTYPIRNAQGEAIGRIGFPIDLKRLTSLIDFSGIPERGSVSLVSPDQKLLLRIPQEPGLLGKSVRSVPEFALHELRTSGQFEAQGIDGINRIYGVEPIPLAGWRVVAGVPRDAALSAAQQAILNAVQWSLLLIVLILILIWRLHRNLNFAVAVLQKAAAIVQSGDVKVRLPETGPAELRAPVEAFNSMLAERDQSEQALRESNLRFQSLMDANVIGVVLCEPEGLISQANDAFLQLIGASHSELEKGMLGLPQLAPSPIQVDRGVESKVNMSATVEQDFKHRDGTRIPVRCTRAIVDERGSFIVLVEDIRERRYQEERIGRLSRMREVTSSINSIIMRVQTRRELFNEACRIAVESGKFGVAWIDQISDDRSTLRTVAMAGDNVNEIACPEGDVRLLSTEQKGVIIRSLQGGKIDFFNDLSSPDGVISERGRRAVEHGYLSVAAVPLVQDGRTIATLILLSNTAGFFDEEELKVLQELSIDISFALDHILRKEKIDFLDYYDPLTGLPNRALFFERMRQPLQIAQQKGGALAVVMLGLSRFRFINEAIGRRLGDAVLNVVASRLQNQLIESELLARIEGDKFVFVLHADAHESDLGLSLSRVMKACFSEPFVFDHQKLSISARVGVAIYPGDGATVGELLRNAEAAMLSAKAQPQGIAFYTKRLNAEVAHALDLEQKLSNALKEGQFRLYYQPKFDAASEKIVGLEALLRWNAPGQGMVSPDVFLPLLEETGLILPIGAWVMMQAVEDFRRWTQMGLDPPRIAVNVSALQISNAGFMDVVLTATDQLSSEEHGLDIEITESILMADLDRSIQMLARLKEAGVGVYVDDFGTGYCSLQYLARLPVDALKIDQSFVSIMEISQNDLAVVSTIISLSRRLGLAVVAEGVETRNQAEMLRSMGCDQLQGYLFSRPLSAEQMEVSLATTYGRMP